MKNEKGELTLGTLVSIILLIAGFAIIVFFLFLMNWGDEVSRETCHQSVIYRGTLPSLGDVKDYIPLKCKTAKYCISSNKKGECEEFKNTEEAQTVQVRDLEEIERFISRDILECWKTMGEGKISIFSNWLNDNFGIGTSYPSCVICSRIAFDEVNLEKAGIDLSKINIRQYMLTHTAPNKEISYAKYLAGENGLMDVGGLGDFEFKELVEENGELVFGEETVSINAIGSDYEPGLQKDFPKDISLFGLKDENGNVVNNVDAVVAVDWNSIYFFKDKNVWRYQGLDRKTDLIGSLDELPFSSSDYILSVDKVDAGFSYDGDIYVFSKNVYWRFKINEFDDLITWDFVKSAPWELDEGKTGQVSNLDGAFFTGSSLYFFKGDDYWRYIPNKDSWGLAEGYPKNINVKWGVPENLDAVYGFGEEGNVYFFKGNEYWRYDDYTIPDELSENSELAIMFMQISSPLGSDVLKNTLSVAGIGMGASFLFSPVMMTRAAFSQVGLMGAMLAGVGLITQQMNVAENRAITAGYCDVVSVGQEAREGCSVVVSTDYDANSISQYCKRIESIA